MGRSTRRVGGLGRTGIPTALLVLAVVANSCSSEGSATEAYFDDVARITAEMAEATLTAVPVGTSPTWEQVSEITDARRRAHDLLDALEPPPETELEHGLLVKTLGDLVDASDTFLSQTADLDPTAFLLALDASVDIDPLAVSFAAACDAIELRSQTLEHPVGLGC